MLFCRNHGGMRRTFIRNFARALLAVFWVICSGQIWASCEYVINSQWGSGFVASIHITNTTGSRLENWGVEWQYSGDNRVTGVWNAKLLGSNPYSATGISWNSSIQPGQTVEFGFQGVGANAEIPVMVGTLCGSNIEPTSTPLPTATPTPPTATPTPPTATPTPPTATPTVTPTPTPKPTSELNQNTIVIEENETGYCVNASVAVESDHAGYVGKGYANTENAQGALLDWQVDAGEPGDAKIKVRFANGGSEARSGALLVNGGADGSYDVSLPATGGWAAWQTVSVNIYLQAGVNSLTLVAGSASGLPNIDSLTVTGVNVLPVSCAGSVITPEGSTLAFPGAMGFGRFAVGGRGGEVVHVTNLNDSGPGSLREAISKPNRIVVFDVGGVIKIKERLVFLNNQTIAGQTAPGDGISIYGNGAAFTNASNTIVRYIRFRMGKIGSNNKDAVSIARGNDFIFDHCSLSWGRDGTLDVSPDSGYTLSNFTFQNSIVAQGLQTHSTGGLMTVEDGGASILRSLYIDNHTRNPKARGVVQFVNNVVYHWAVAGYILGDSAADSGARYDGALVGNMFISGPETSGAVMKSGSTVYHLYAKDNWYDPNKDGRLNPTLLGKSGYGSVTWYDAPPIDYPEVPTLSASAALDYVIANAGASKSRDAVDQFLMDELQSWGTKGKTISDEASLGLPNVVGNIRGGVAPTDTDRDGMPDSWEQQNGLNPNSAADAMQDRDGDGWVNVEEYINSLVL